MQYFNFAYSQIITQKKVTLRERIWPPAHLIPTRGRSRPSIIFHVSKCLYFLSFSFSTVSDKFLPYLNHRINTSVLVGSFFKQSRKAVMFTVFLCVSVTFKSLLFRTAHFRRFKPVSCIASYLCFASFFVRMSLQVCSYACIQQPTCSSQLGASASFPILAGWKSLLYCTRTASKLQYLPLCSQGSTMNMNTMGPLYHMVKHGMHSNRPLGMSLFIGKCGIRCHYF